MRLKALRWVLLALLMVALSAFFFAIGLSLGSDNGDSARSSITTAPHQSTTRSADAPDFGVLDEIYQLLRNNHIDGDFLDPEMSRLGAIEGLLNTLNDPHTTYIDPRSYACGIDILSGSYEGIGATVEMQNGEIIIATPFKDSPAEKAGIRPGDAIIAINGQTTAGMSLSQAVCRIRGPRGEPITLTIRHVTGETEELTIVRDRIVVESVRTQTLEDADGNPVDDIAYLEIQQFTERTPSEIAAFLREIQGKGYKGLILDLRRNPGGLLDTTIESADLFLDSGVILIQVDASGNEREYRAHPGGETSLPLVLLVGPGSASGAEVMAAALRDNGRAIIIGQPTFGKGAVNSLRPLSDGGALYITIARWLTPRGEQIEGTGILPDIEVVPTEEQIRLGLDLQLPVFQAIDYLRSQAACQQASC